MSILTILLTDACSLLVPAALVVWMLVRRRNYVPTTDLSRCGNVIVHGVVEAEATPVTVAITQHRVEMGAASAARMDGKTVYDWDEQDRQIHGMPFVLRTPTIRIQVEPDEDDVWLLWDPDHTEAVDKWHRIRRATLEPGASVEVFGAFKPAATTGEPYRESAALPTLVPSRADRLLISKKPLAPKFAAMRRYLAVRAAAIVPLAAVAHVAIEPIWQADLAQLHLAEPSMTARAWIAIGFAAIAYYGFRTKRPWNAGKFSERVAT